MSKLKVLLVGLLFSVSIYGQRLPKNCIQLVESFGGVYEIAVEMEGLKTVPFIADTGASECSMPAYIIYTLIKCGAIQEKDALEDREYLISDGSTVVTKRFMLKYLKIGNYTIKNIEVSMSMSSSSPPLIGQNLLKKLGRITIDYNTHTLCVEN